MASCILGTKLAASRYQRPQSNVSQRLISRPRIPAAQRLCLAAGAVAEPASTRASWWERDAPPNVKHLSGGVQGLVDELALAAKDDRLLVIDFFGPWCNSCRALYPKLTKIAEEHSDVTFLCVNVETDNYKDIAKRLGVKVLPFFQFYRGAEGKIDEFPASLTKAAKLKEAISQHKSPRCYLTEYDDKEEHPVLEEFPDVVPQYTRLD